MFFSRRGARNTTLHSRSTGEVLSRSREGNHNQRQRMSSQTNAPNASNSDPRTFKGEGCMGQLEAGIAISGSLSGSCRAQAPTNCSQLARQIPRMPCWQPQPPPFDAGPSRRALLPSHNCFATQSQPWGHWGAQELDQAKPAEQLDALRA